jgi:hypothetical protein
MAAKMVARAVMAGLGKVRANRMLQSPREQIPPVNGSSAH